MRKTTRKQEIEPGRLRIIGGKFRGRILAYHGQPHTRPMKDRVREAVFDLLGPAVFGCQAIDLFAGTGALGLEALSRGALHATLIERHFPTAQLIAQNVRTLDVTDQATIVASDTFYWARHTLPKTVWMPGPWLVFCSPPYALYRERAADLRQVLEQILRFAPADSTLVVESDEQFDPAQLPQPELWTTRTYTPAVIWMRKEVKGER